MAQLGRPRIALRTHHSLLVGRLALLLALLLATSGWAGAQTSPSAILTVTPAAIPLSDPELVNPLRGFYRWYGVEGIPQPRPALDHYVRYGWRALEPARGQYDFSAIDRDLQTAQAAGAKLGFRVMSVNEFSSPVEVPSYLQSLAGGKYCSYNGKSVWVPTWDSPQFIERARALTQALSAHLNGDPRLAYYDLGIYGHWGEWHTGGLCTPGATSATKHALVDMQVAAFSSSRMLMNAGGGEDDAFVYALSRSPRIGIRADNLCDPSFEQQFTFSTAKLAAMQDRWKTAPLMVEYIGGGHANVALCDQQVRSWHVAAVGGGNFGSWSSYSAAEQAQLILLGKHSGYRLQLNSLSYPAQVTPGQFFTITSQWSNVGVTPLYERFVPTFELRPLGQSTVVWAGLSQLDLQQLLPNQPLQISDSLVLPRRIPAGRYDLRLVLRDPTGSRAPLTLASSGGDSSGRYVLGELVVDVAAPAYEALLPYLQR